MSESDNGQTAKAVEEIRENLSTAAQILYREAEEANNRNKIDSPIALYEGSQTQDAVKQAVKFAKTVDNLLADASGMLPNRQEIRHSKSTIEAAGGIGAAIVGGAGVATSYYLEAPELVIVLSALAGITAGGFGGAAGAVAYEGKKHYDRFASTHAGQLLLGLGAIFLKDKVQGPGLKNRAARYLVDKNQSSEAMIGMEGRIKKITKDLIKALKSDHELAIEVAKEFIAVLSEIGTELAPELLPSLARITGTIREEVEKLQPSLEKAMEKEAVSFKEADIRLIEEVLEPAAGKTMSHLAEATTALENLRTEIVALAKTHQR